VNHLLKLTTAILLCFVVAGCGGKDEGKKEEAKTTDNPPAKNKTDTPPSKEPPATAAPKDQLVGTWNLNLVVDDAKLKEVLETVKDEQEKLQLSQMALVFAGVKGTITINEDETYEYTMVMSFMGEERKETKKGTWKLVEATDKRIVIDTKDEGDEKTEQRTMDIQSKTHMTENAPEEQFGAIREALKVHYRK